MWSLPKIAKVDPEDDHKKSLATFEDSQEKKGLAIFEDGQTKFKEDVVGYLRQNLTNLEKSIEEDVFTIDVSDLICGTKIKG